jgi:DNA-binding response OmpR family regulator
VETAGSGKQALDRLAATRYDLMLLDLRLPDADGLTVMRAARASHPDLLIILLTAYADQASAIAAVQAGAADYLCKPVSIYQVRAAVEQALCARAARAQRLSVLQTVARAAQSLRLPPPRGGAFGFAAISRDSRLRAGPLLLDVQRRQVCASDREDVPSTELTEHETAVLAALMAQPGRVLSCRVLARSFTSHELERWEAESLIRPLIYRLRRKLEVYARRSSMIRTVRGNGYGLAVSDTPPGRASD